MIGPMDTLFTDLDPLGTGKSKPYTDKKNFFPVSKGSPMMSAGSLSRDSLTHVGFEDSLWEGCVVGGGRRRGDSGSLWEEGSRVGGGSDSPHKTNTCIATTNITNSNLSDLAYSVTNPVQSSSYIPCQVSQQRRISENSLRVALPPEDGSGRRRSVSPGGDQGGGGLTTHLSVSPSGGCDQGGLNPHSSYGSILELEASPRRYRTSELHELYSRSQDSPSCSSSRYGDCRDSSVDSSLNIPMPAEPPPALPERPSKSNSLSPPPLPPKKQLYNMTMSSFVQANQNISGGGSNEVYQYIPGNSTDYAVNLRPDEMLTSKQQCYEAAPAAAADGLPGSLGQDISVSELVNMNVLELSQKLNEGKLPHHLSGMSLFELVDYIGKHAANSADSGGGGGHVQPGGGQRNTPDISGLSIKPAFSDSFVSTSSKPDLSSSSTYNASQICNRLGSLDTSAPTATNPPQENSSPMFRSTNTFSMGSLSSLHSSYTASLTTLPRHHQLPAAVSRVDSRDIGFEDDFSQFNPSPTPAAAAGPIQKQGHPSGQTVSADTTEYPSSTSNPDPLQPPPAQQQTFDKYAVFRELQLEEELANAWKSPTDENKDEGLLLGGGEVAELEEEAGEEAEGEDTPRTQEDILATCDDGGEEEEEERANADNLDEDTFFDTTDKDEAGEVSFRSCNTEVERMEEPVAQDQQDRFCLSTSATATVEELRHDVDNVQPSLEVELDPDLLPQAGFGDDHQQHQPNDSCQGLQISPTPPLAATETEPPAEWATFDEGSRRSTTSSANFEFSSFLSKDEQERMLGGAKKSIFKPEFMRKESYTKLPDFRPDNDGVAAGGIDTEHEIRSKFSIQSPKSLRDLPTTASFQARYQNFKRFDQQQPSPPLSPKPSFKNQRLNQEEDEDPFVAEWEPAFYTRNVANDNDSWDLSFQTENGNGGQQQQQQQRSRRLTGRHQQSNLEEAFPPLQQDRLRSGRSSSRASSENMFNNPFNDNFVPTTNGGSGGGAMSATPPVFEGDRISNHSEMSFQSGDILHSGEIFERDVGLNDRALKEGHDDRFFKAAFDDQAFKAGFDDETFRVEAKTKVTKSDSVNIFSVADDPFDDDFFK